VAASQRQGSCVATIVELHRVGLRYGGDDEGTLALQDLNFSVQEGEFVAVVGPSGCGKSTLMKVVSGLWRASAGAVVVRNKEVTGPLSFVGMAFQNPNLLPWRNTLRNIMLPLEIVQPHAKKLRSERPAYLERARDLLRLVGLGEFEARFPWQLSGGMQQRASLCRALIHEPALLMLDEPFGALDMFTREELWLALQELWLARRPTVILVTHDLREAVFLADRVLVMSNRPGKIIADYTVNLARPRTLDDTFRPEAISLFQELRDLLSSVRKKAA
jgi:NitT/TauT family transport system ATP-binding protein